MSRLERSIWLGTALSAALTIWIWTRPQARLTGRPFSVPAAHSPRLFDPDSLAAAAQFTAEGDLFQPDRAADNSPPVVPNTQASPQVAAKPRLVLRGLIGGPPWDVIIDGLPGHPAGTVVRDGETVAGFFVRVEGPRTVRIRGADTTWTLVLGGA